MEQIVSVLLRATGASQFGGQMAQMVSHANVAQHAVQHLSSTLNMVKMAVAGAVGGFTLNAVMNLGKEFENTQNKMAGYLTSLGEAPDFNTALQQSADIYKQIELTSAALPGEAEDYVRVFTTALPQIQRSIGGTMDEMVKFSNQVAAVGATFGIDSMQIANDMRRLLQPGKGGAGMDVQLFTQMLPFLQQIEGQANLTTESFNAMGEAQRAALLKQVVYGNGISEMIANAANGWEAMSGTLAAIAKTVWRMGTSPLFDGMKQGAQVLAGYFMDADGQLTSLGNTLVGVTRIISEGLVVGVQTAARGISWLVGNFERLYNTVAGAVLPIFQTKIDMVVAALPSLGSALDYATSAIMGLWNVIQPLLPIFQILTDAALGLVLNAIEPMMRGMGDFVETVASFGGWFGEMIGEIMWWLVPPIQSLGTGIGKLIEGLLHFAGPVIGLLVGGVLKIAEYVAPVVGFLIDRLAEFGRGLGEILYWLGDKMRAWFGMEMTTVKQAPATKKLGEAAGGIATFLRNMKAGMAWASLGGAAAPDLSGLKRRARTPGARGGTKIHQDFRNSRFTIDQKFEEGFDPDRIAISFANDLQRIGEFRLHSGLDPLYALR